jgi:hypothetical protein
MTDLVAMRSIPDFPGYWIFEDGTIYSLKRHKWMKRDVDRDGYVNFVTSGKIGIIHKPKGRPRKNDQAEAV